MGQFLGLREWGREREKKMVVKKKKKKKKKPNKPGSSSSLSSLTPLSVVSSFPTVAGSRH
jgi:hypothetical protein